MSTGPIPPRLLELFAALLEYPAAGTAEAARECAALALVTAPETTALLREFRQFARRTAPSRLQELYTRSFDLDAACHPYVGHHLFGESHKRSVFMVGLKDRYAKEGFRPDERELPDHVAVILRYLAVCRDEETAGELIHLALLPALGRMTKDGDAAGAEPQGGTGYAALLAALRLVLDHWPRPADLIGPAEEGACPAAASGRPPCMQGGETGDV